MREKIRLNSTAGTGHFYTTTKNKRTMTENSTVMVHEGSAFEMGKTSDVLKGADHLKKLQTNINRILGDVTNKSQEFWEDVSKQDTYLTSEECLEYGIVDEIT